MNYKYKFESLYNLIIALLGLLLGILLMVMKESILTYIIRILGFAIIAMAVIDIVFASADFNNENNKAVLAESIIMLIAGFILFFYTNWIVILILGIALIGFPIYRILISKNKKKQLKEEMLKILIGLFIILISQTEAFKNTISLLFYIAGAIIVICSAISLVMYVALHIKNKNTIRKENKDNEVIDV